MNILALIQLVSSQYRKINQYTSNLKYTVGDPQIYYARQYFTQLSDIKCFFGQKGWQQPCYVYGKLIVSKDLIFIIKPQLTQTKYYNAIGNLNWETISIPQCKIWIAKNSAYLLCASNALSNNPIVFFQKSSNQFLQFNRLNKNCIYKEIIATDNLNFIIILKDNFQAQILQGPNYFTKFQLNGVIRINLDSDATHVFFTSNGDIKKIRLSDSEIVVKINHGWIVNQIQTNLNRIFVCQSQSVIVLNQFLEKIQLINKNCSFILSTINRLYVYHSNINIQYQKCNKYLYQQVSLCVDQCPIGYQSKQGICVICLYDQELSSCIKKCSINKYSFNNRCLKCNLPCLRCYNQFSCIGCQDIILDSGKCCSFPNLVNQIQKVCQPCNDYILGFYCMKNCPAGYRQGLQKVCIPCHQNCKQCTKIICLSCNLDFIPFNDYCISQCPQYYFLEKNHCNACQPNCIKCNKNQCFLCSSGLILNNQCTNKCPAGYNAFNQRCYLITRFFRQLSFKEHYFSFPFDEKLIVFQKQNLTIQELKVFVQFELNQLTFKFQQRKGKVVLSIYCVQRGSFQLSFSKSSDNLKQRINFNCLAEKSIMLVGLLKEASQSIINICNIRPQIRSFLLFFSPLFVFSSFQSEWNQMPFQLMLLHTWLTFGKNCYQNSWTSSRILKTETNQSNRILLYFCLTIDILLFFTSVLLLKIKKSYKEIQNFCFELFFTVNYFLIIFSIVELVNHMDLVWLAGILISLLFLITLFYRHQVIINSTFALSQFWLNYPEAKLILTKYRVVQSTKPFKFNFLFFFRNQFIQYLQLLSQIFQCLSLAVFQNKLFSLPFICLSTSGILFFIIKHKPFVRLNQLYIGKQCCFSILIILSAFEAWLSKDISDSKRLYAFFGLGWISFILVILLALMQLAVIINNCYLAMKNIDSIQITKNLKGLYTKKLGEPNLQAAQIDFIIQFSDLNHKEDNLQILELNCYEGEFLDCKLLCSTTICQQQSRFKSKHEKTTLFRLERNKSIALINVFRKKGFRLARFRLFDSLYRLGKQSIGITNKFQPIKYQLNNELQIQEVQDWMVKMHQQIMKYAKSKRHLY